MNDPTRPVSDEQVLAWMSMHEEGTLDAETAERLAGELPQRPHLLEARSWLGRIDDLTRENDRAAVLPPLDTAALSARVLERVRSEGPRPVPRAPWWRWAPALALLALAGVFSWQQLKQDPQVLEPRDEGLVREMEAPPIRLDTTAGQALEDEMESSPSFGASPVEEVAQLAKEPGGPRTADLDVEGVGESADRAKASLRPEPLGAEAVLSDLDATPRPQVPAGDGSSADAGSPARRNSKELTDYAVDAVEEAVARQRTELRRASSLAPVPTTSVLRWRLLRADAGPALDAEIEEILRAHPRQAEPATPTLLYERTPLRARSTSDAAPEPTTTPMDSLEAALRERLAEIEDDALRQRVETWLGRE